MQQIEPGVVLPRHGGGVADGLPVQVGVIERHQNAPVDRSLQAGADRLRQSQRRTAEAADPAFEQGLERHPGQQQEQQGPQRSEAQPDHPAAVAGHGQPVADGRNHQPQVQPDDDRGRDPRQYRNPCPIGESSHAAAVAGEVDQGNDGERQLHAEDDLAQDQKLEGPLRAGEVHGNGCWRDGHQARH